MMNQRTREIFARFFDPGVPYLFLIGAVFLAIVGNGTYDLLQDVFGSTFATRLGIVGVSLIIGVGIIFGFSVWLAARWQPGKTAVPPEQTAEPKAALVLLISTNPQGAEMDIVTFHMADHTLRHCWLIVSPDVRRSGKAASLEAALTEANVAPHPLHLADVNQVDLAYEVIEKAIKEASEEVGLAEVIVDVTGGTKLMSIGAALACRDNNVPLQYMATRKEPDGSPIPNTSVPMKVELGTVGQSRASL